MCLQNDRVLSLLSLPVIEMQLMAHSLLWALATLHQPLILNLQMCNPLLSASKLVLQVLQLCLHCGLLVLERRELLLLLSFRAGSSLTVA